MNNGETYNRNHFSKRFCVMCLSETFAVFIIAMFRLISYFKNTVEIKTFKTF